MPNFPKKEHFLTPDTATKTRANSLKTELKTVAEKKKAEVTDDLIKFR